MSMQCLPARAFLCLFWTLLFLLIARVHSSKNLQVSRTSQCINQAQDISYPRSPLHGERHELERTALLKRIDRDTGKWDKKHPRWQLLEALQGFDRYKDVVGAEISRFEDLYKHVPKKQKKLLESTISYRSNFQEARTRVQHNTKFCKQVVDFSLPFYNITRHELNAFMHDTDDGKTKSGLRMTVSQTLKHMVRDWSPEGHAERDATFPYILDALAANLPAPLDGGSYEILVPGAGLGRLPHEISRLGPYMRVTSNEWSASMNMAYRYLASIPNSATFGIHPFLESWSHARTRNDLFRSVSITPNAVAGTDNLVLEGDFTTLPLSPGTFDAIPTLFFIDTARNLIAYLEQIHSLLKPGGIWINVGPLLYGSAPLVQLSLDEIITVAEEIGFEFQHRDEKDVLYNFNASTLYKHGYVAQCWVARKKESRNVKVDGHVWERLKKSVVGD